MIPRLDSILPTEMASTKNSYSSNMSSENSSARGSGIEDLTDLLLPTDELFLTHPENALCFPIGPVVRVDEIKMFESHCFSRLSRKLLFLPQRLSMYSILRTISDFVNSVVVNTVNKTLNSTSSKNLGCEKANSLSVRLGSFQNALRRRNLSIFSSLHELQVFQKDWLRVSSDEGEYAFQEVARTCFFFPLPINNRISERGKMGNCFFSLAIFPWWYGPTSGYRQDP